MVHGLLSRVPQAQPAGQHALVVQGIEQRPSKPRIPVRVRTGVPARDLGERFWSHVDRSQNSPGGCWPWTASRTPRGYGRIQCGSRADGTRRPLQSHRLAYLLGNGPLGDAEVVRHRCNNPICCNPAHLLSGSQLDNVKDMVDSDRQAKGPAHPMAKLTQADVVEIRHRRLGGQTTTSLASRFAVSQSLISQICRGVLWRSESQTAHEARP